MIEVFKIKINMNQWINYMLVILAFAFPLSAKKAEIIMLLLDILWIIEGNWQYKFLKLKRFKPFWYYFAFVLLIGFSLIWSDTLYGGFVKHYPQNGVLAYVQMYLLYFMLVPVMITSIQRKYIKVILSAFLLAMFISEIASWGLFLGLIDIKGRLTHDPSPFMHHSLYSIFLAVTIFILITEFSKIKQIGLKILMALFVISALTNLFLNGGRLGQLAFFVALIVYFIKHFGIGFKSIVLGMVSIISIFLLAYYSSPIFHTRANLSMQSLQHIAQGDFHSSWGARVYALIVAKDIVLEHPLFGVGIADAKKAYMKQTESYSQGKMVRGFWHMHNQYMQILLETGMIGLMIFLLFIYQMLKLPLADDMHILFVSFITVYLVGFIGEPLFWNRQPFLLFNFMIGLFLLFSENWQMDKKSAKV